MGEALNPIRKLGSWRRLRSLGPFYSRRSLTLSESYSVEVRWFDSSGYQKLEAVLYHGRRRVNVTRSLRALDGVVCWAIRSARIDRLARLKEVAQWTRSKQS